MNAPFNVHRLRKCRIVDQASVYSSLESTNNHARRMAEHPFRHNVLIIAESQTDGRGRGANRWWTGAGAIACSLLFDPRARGVDVSRSALVSLTAAIAIAEAIAPRLPAEEVGLHWPNDVFLAGKKVAGILTESLPDGRQVLGAGINVNNSIVHAPEDVARYATSMIDIADAPFDRTELLVDILERLDDLVTLLATKPDDVGRMADELCLQRGKRLTIESGNQSFTGFCAGIAADGALLLELPGGQSAFYSGVIQKDPPPVA